jgi:hypothetical protein
VEGEKSGREYITDPFAACMVRLQSLRFRKSLQTMDWAPGKFLQVCRRQWNWSVAKIVAY